MSSVAKCADERAGEHKTEKRLMSANSVRDLSSCSWLSARQI